jgi:putative membrane protein
MFLKLLVRWGVLAVAIALTAWIIPGIAVQGSTNQEVAISVALIALVLGLVNAVLGPILRVLTCSVIVLTLGLFSLVLNTALLYITAWLLPDRLQIDSFWAAFLGSLIISIIHSILTSLLIEKKKK